MTYHETQITIPDKGIIETKYGTVLMRTLRELVNRNENADIRQLYLALLYGNLLKLRKSRDQQFPEKDHITVIGKVFRYYRNFLKKKNCKAMCLFIMIYNVPIVARTQ